ncbi:MAG: hypothetical protein WCK63_14840 [Betaproteobacteria bacterium]
MNHTRRTQLREHIATFGIEPAKDLFDIFGRESGRKYLEVSEQTRYARSLLDRGNNCQFVAEKLQVKFKCSRRTAYYRLESAKALPVQ